MMQISASMETTSEWVDIPGSGGKYKVNKEGEVWSEFQKGKLKPYLNKGGYLRMRYWGKGNQRLIHRLVAQAFIPNPNNYPQVNHIDGVKTNNKVSNLEWCSPSQNVRHAVCNGLRTTDVLTPENIREIRHLLRVSPFTQRELGEMYEVTQPMISMIKTKWSWSHV